MDTDSTVQTSNEKCSKMETSQTESVDYFTSYNDTNVQELMLKDRPRTLAYKTFFEENREYIQDKVVMDIGSGTGILAMFAAAAGAKKVYAIEASDMAEICKNIIECNGFEEKIEVLQSRVEDVELPDGVKVDIIVSEWMGFYLFHESMLDSVIYARDNFLKPNGVMVPSHANLLIAPVNMDKYSDDHFEYWNNCYGFDLSPMISLAMATAAKEPLITEVRETQILADSDYVAAFDLKIVSLDDISSIYKSCDFHMTNTCTVHGFVCWFNVVFTCPSVSGIHDISPINSNSDNIVSDDANNSCTNVVDDTNSSANNNVSIGNSGNTVHTINSNTSANVEDSVNDVNSTSKLPITLSTGPSAETTHWKQTVIFLPSAIEFEKGDSLPCQIELTKDLDNKRHYNISIELATDQDNDEIETEANDHPIPCECGAPRCLLIKTVMEKFAEEQDEVENEAENTEKDAEIEAARVLDSETIGDISI